MPTNITVTKKLLVYAQNHKLEIPKVSTVNPAWGQGKKTLAWRVSGHLAEHGVHVPVSARKTPELVAHFFPPTFGEIVVKVALAEVGTTEHPANSNDGPRVHLYQSSTGAYRQPWCASGAKWTFVEAAKQAKKKVRFPAQAAWVPAWTAMIRAGQNGWKRVEPRDGRAGDVATLWNSGHIEIVLSAGSDGLHCVGFNTSPVGQNANGGMVAKTFRTYGEVTVVGRLK
jgi:hypothetical protein